MAYLELMYLDVLDHTQHGIPNLEAALAESPEFFAQTVAFAFKRDDDGEDPPELQANDPTKQRAVSSRAYNLLSRVRKIPGSQDGQVDASELMDWIEEARSLCHQLARRKVGDICLGEWLARTPQDEAETWPDEAICKAMEGIATEALARGFLVGVHNSRGAVARGLGGAQERELAKKYRRFAQLLHFEYPFVGGVLEDIADSYEREASTWDVHETLTHRLHS